LHYQNTNTGEDSSPHAPLPLPNSKDPYVILNIHRQASKGEIKRAYHEAALRYHPDVRLHSFSTTEDRQSANDDFARINEAYHAILTRMKRTERHRPSSVHSNGTAGADADARARETAQKNKRQTPFSEQRVKQQAAKQAWSNHDFSRNTQNYHHNNPFSTVHTHMPREHGNRAHQGGGSRFREGFSTAKFQGRFGHGQVYNPNFQATSGAPRPKGKTKPNRNDVGERMKRGDFFDDKSFHKQWNSSKSGKNGGVAPPYPTSGGSSYFGVQPNFTHATINNSNPNIDVTPSNTTPPQTNIGVQPNASVPFPPTPSPQTNIGVQPNASVPFPPPPQTNIGVQPNVSVPFPPPPQTNIGVQPHNAHPSPRNNSNPNIGVNIPPFPPPKNIGVHQKIAHPSAISNTNPNIGVNIPPFPPRNNIGVHPNNARSSPINNINPNIGVTSSRAPFPTPPSYQGYGGISSPYKKPLKDYHKHTKKESSDTARMKKLMKTKERRKRGDFFDADSFHNRWNPYAQ
jgi:curved DNA-binding protein CbpA